MRCHFSKFKQRKKPAFDSFMLFSPQPAGQAQVGQDVDRWENHLQVSIFLGQSLFFWILIVKQIRWRRPVLGGRIADQEKCPPKKMKGNPQYYNLISPVCFAKWKAYIKFGRHSLSKVDLRLRKRTQFCLMDVKMPIKANSLNLTMVLSSPWKVRFKVKLSPLNWVESLNLVSHFELEKDSQKVKVRDSV